MGIDDVLRKPIDAGLIPGVVALAADDRGIFYEGAFGWREVDKPEPMTLDSVFRIASMTKAVTGTAAMQLVEQGRIGLDQPVGDLLPVVKNVKVLEGFCASRPLVFSCGDWALRFCLKTHFASAKKLQH
jgi:methyl acetate hydrolase